MLPSGHGLACVIGGACLRDKAQIVPRMCRTHTTAGGGWHRLDTPARSTVMSAQTRLSFLGALAVSVLVALAPAPSSAQEVRLTAPGASENLQTRLRGISLLLRPPEDGSTRTGEDIVAAARADYGRLIGVLYEEGFFAPVITITLDGRDATTISPFDPPPAVRNVDISVVTGAPFRLGEARIAPLAPGTELPAGFRGGEPATTPLLRDTTAAALNAWRQQGRAIADVADQSIRADNRAAILDVAIRVEPGPVITFGQLLPEGQERMRVARILEIAGLPTGEVYSPEALTRAEARLRETGVFSAVALQLRDPRDGAIADVTAILDEAPLRRLGFGAELSSDEGVQLSAYWLHRNLFGGAERLRFDATVSGINADVDGIDGELTARFERPATFSPDTDLALELGFAYLDEPLFSIEALSFGAGLTHDLTDRLTLRGGVGVDRIRFSSALGSATVTRLTLPLGATFDGRDDPLDARAGLYGDITLTPFKIVGDGGRAHDLRVARPTAPSARTPDPDSPPRLRLGHADRRGDRDSARRCLLFRRARAPLRGLPSQSLGSIQNGVPAAAAGFPGACRARSALTSARRNSALSALRCRRDQRRCPRQLASSDCTPARRSVCAYATPFGPTPGRMLAYASPAPTERAKAISTSGSGRTSDAAPASPSSPPRRYSPVPRPVSRLQAMRRRTRIEAVSRDQLSERGAAGVDPGVFRGALSSTAEMDRLTHRRCRGACG